MVLLERVERLVKDHTLYTKRVYVVMVPRKQRSPMQWFAPPPGVVKLKLDASLASESWAGLGVVARNDRGDVLFAATRRVRASCPP